MFGLLVMISFSSTTLRPTRCLGDDLWAKTNNQNLFATAFPLVAAGLLVGIGTRMGNGCTSGHGVCGLTRRSGRSLAATLAFMATGFATASLIQVAMGGAL